MKSLGSVAALLAAMVLAPAAAAAATCSEDVVDVRGSWGQARFNIELANDPDERAQGLMFRETMAASAGMLFIYDAPQRASFWMKNTLLPLDMIFVDATGVVTRIHENAIPQDITPIDGGAGVLAVLEINGGLAAAMGINPGSQLRHPEFDPEIAVWSCAD